MPAGGERMQRHELLQLMATLQLSGMRAPSTRSLPTASGASTRSIRCSVPCCRPRWPKRARSIRYQMGAARLPLAKTVEDFRFAGTPINEALVRDLRAAVPREPAQRRIRRRNR